MNIIKMFLIAATGIGFGFTTTQFVNNNDSVDSNTDEYYTGCHFGEYDEEFLDHFLSHFSEEDQLTINAYIDTLLEAEGVTLEDLDTDWDLRHEIMNQIHEYIETQGFDYQYDEEYPHHGHMGW